MGYTYRFKPGVTYGANDINQITQFFTTAGIKDPFTDGQPYNVTSLNGVISAVATSGAVPETIDTLKVTVQGENAVIAPGSAIFADGSTITVDDDGVLLPLTPGKVQQVYLLNNQSTFQNVPMIGDALPDADTEDFVPLAEVAANGAVTDKRQFSHGKVANMSCSNIALPLSMVTPSYVSEYAYVTYDDVQRDVVLTTVGEAYRYAVVRSFHTGSDNCTDITEKNYPYSFCFYDMQEGYRLLCYGYFGTDGKGFSASMNSNEVYLLSSGSVNRPFSEQGYLIKSGGTIKLRQIIRKKDTNRGTDLSLDILFI